MRPNIRVLWPVVALGLAACRGQSAMDEQMKRDLDAASVSTMELAPAGGGQRVTSAIEQIPQGQSAPTGTAKKASAPAKTPEPPRTADRTAPESAGPAATRPTQRPAINPPPPGGYKTVDEVLRKAPFPIKP